MFSGRRSARSETGVAVETGAAVDGGLAAGAPCPASASVKTGVEVFSGKTDNLGSTISGNVADFSRGKSESEARSQRFRCSTRLPPQMRTLYLPSPLGGSSSPLLDVKN